MDTKRTNKTVSLPINEVQFSMTPVQVSRRQHFDKTSLKELSESIAKHGLLQPVIVQQIQENGKDRYILIAGERRCLAAKAAGLETIDAVIRDCTEAEIIEIQIMENLQRENLHPMHEAEAYEILLQQEGFTINELHHRLGKSKSYVYKRLKLLNLCPAARELFYANKIGFDHALVIARVENVKDQKRITDYCKHTIDSFDVVSVPDLKQYIETDIICDLRNAPFDIKDSDLLPSAGACATCPKSSKNQPELFDDVSKNTNLCTDPGCYQQKINAFNKQVVAEAKAQGGRVISKTEAKKIAPHGITYSTKWKRLDERNYHDSERRTNRKILGDLEGIETALIEDNGQMVEIVATKEVNRALQKNSPKAPKSTGKSDQQKAKEERQFRLDLYLNIREELDGPDDVTLAAQLFQNLGTDEKKRVCEIWDFKPAKNRYNKLPNYDSITKKLTSIKTERLYLFMNDCLFASELVVKTWDRSKPTRILSAAKQHGLDISAIRADIKTKQKKTASANSKKGK